MLRKYEDIFPEKFIDKALYFNLLCHIFSYGFDEDYVVSHGLLPMGEKCNHHTDQPTSATILNLRLQASGDRDHIYFKSSNAPNDYSAILSYDVGKKITEEQKKHFHGRFDKETFQKYEEMLSVENVRN